MARHPASGLTRTLGLAAGAGLLVSAAARRARRIDLKGRVVVVTGGARGLGFAIARSFLQRGGRLAICGRNGDTVAEAVQALRSEDADVFGMACDVSDAGQVQGFIEQVVKRFGTIDVLNSTSIAGKLPVAHQAAYTAGKYALTGGSETLAIKPEREGIRVSTLTPPPLRNGAPLNVHFNGSAEEEFLWFTRVLTARLGTTTADRTARAVVDTAA